MAIQSTAMAVQNLLLAASAMRLGACWLCAPLFCQETVRVVLALPKSWLPQGIVTLGVPRDAGVWRGHRPLNDVVTMGEMS